MGISKSSVLNCHGNPNEWKDFSQTLDSGGIEVLGSPVKIQEKKQNLPSQQLHCTAPF
jgi:hypothetical protein